MTDTATLQIRVNGGAPQTGGIYVANSDTIQLTAPSKTGWSVLTRWEIYDYPEGVTCPAGWSTDTDDTIAPTYFYQGTADPPSFTTHATKWGGYKTRLVVPGFDTDEATFIKVLSPSGYEAQCAEETSQFGGAKLQKDKAYNENLRIIEDATALMLAYPGATELATPGEIAQRAAVTAACAFGPLTAPSIASSTTSLSALNSAGEGLTITSGNVALGSTNNISGSATGNISLLCDTDAEIVAGGAISLSGDSGASLTSTTGTATVSAATTVGITASSGAVSISGSAGAINLQRAASTGATITVHPTGAFSVVPVAGATSVTYQQAQATVGAGVAALYGAQRGFAGSIGGYSQIGADNGGTPGTNLAGGVRAELGTLVTNQSAKLSFRAGGSEFAFLRQQGASSETILSSAGALDLDSATSTVNLMANGSTSVVWTLSASGVVTLAPVGGAASLTIKPAQKTSGAGAAVTIAGGQGSSGNVGGKTTVGANNGATPGTNLAGGVDIELGQTVGGVSALASVVANGTTLCTFQQTASAQCEISNLALIWLKGASGCLIGSNDDAVRIYCNQSDGTITIKGTSGAVRIQDTSVTWLEMARVAAGRNVVSLAAGANLDTTKMPANTGNGVVFLANAATAPTVSSDSTGTIIYGESSQVRVRETNGFASALNYIDDSAGGTLKREIKSLGRATTSSTTITTITTIRAAQMPGKGCGIAIIRGFGYDTVTDTVSGHFCRRVVILSVSGALTIVDDDPIGTDALGGGTLTIDVSTDVRVRIQCKDTSNTRWTATVDMHYVEH